MTTCRKITYETRKMAKRAARTIKAVGRGNLMRGYVCFNVLRPYYCTVCNFWHLTKGTTRRMF